MSRRLLAAAALAVGLAAPAAHAGTTVIPVPTRGCAVYVSVVNITIYPGVPGPGIGLSGDTGAWTDCP
ncbi:MAG TPA: hypothetical protein VF519_00800 [Mycobacteriales bacterium]